MRFPSLTDTDDLVSEPYVRLIRARQNGRMAKPKNFPATAALHATLALSRRNRVIPFESVGECDRAGRIRRAALRT